MKLVSLLKRQDVSMFVQYSTPKIHKIVAESQHQLTKNWIFHTVYVEFCKKILVLRLQSSIGLCIKAEWLPLRLRFIYTYIIGDFNPSVRIIKLVSHTTYVVCVNFLYISGWDLQFKVNSKRQICWETFHGSFIYYSEFLPEICWEDIAEEILFYVFCFDVWPEAWTLALRLISQHTTN